MWYRVAGLKPRLRSHAALHRHEYRGQPWYVLQDRASTRYYRLSANSQQFIGLLDGRRTVQEIWHVLNEGLGDEAPTQSDVIQLLGKLHAADVLQSDVVPDSVEILARGDQAQRQKWKQRLMRPLAVRIPIWDPDRFLSRTCSMVAPVFSSLSMFLWTALTLIALLLAISHWTELTAHWSARAMDPHNLLLLWFLYPLVKAFHELGHAYATKVWGGEVHEMGVMLLVLMPIPYVDASSANAFGEKRRRIAVGAAGIMVEVFLSALALILWLNVQPGLVRDMAFDVMLIGGISTVLFNGNPLLRFDGYYVLADAIEIPNLASRSSQYLGYLSKRYLFGLTDSPSRVTAAGERAWFVIYCVASFVYRLFISFAIALFVAGKFFVIGIALAIWALATQLLFPFGKAIGFVLFGPALQGRRIRAVTITGGAALGVILLLSLMPFFSWTRAEGILQLPEKSVVRAGTDGFIVKLLSRDGEEVQAGDPLFELEDPLLKARVSVLAWRLRELQARKAAVLITDPIEAGILADEIADAQAELDEASSRLSKLTVHSPDDGTFVVPRAKDLPGRFVAKGDSLGHVADLSQVTARVVVPQTAVDLVRRHTEVVEIRLANRPGETLYGHIKSEVPSATGHLPSRVLGTQGGGTIAVDARDTEGLRTIDRVFQFDIDLPPRPGGDYVASRVHVRFNHGAEPLARQWYRRLRQLFLARLQL